MDYINKRINVEYDLNKSVFKTIKDILNELKIILNEENGYRYNPSLKKHKKYFAASLDIPFDKHQLLVIKEKSKNRVVSYSLSSKPIKEQISIDMYLASERVYNLIHYYSDENTLLNCVYINNIDYIPTLLPMKLRYDLVKYDNKQSIKNKFPDFFNEKDNRQYYDVIYTIKSENNKYKYIDATNETYCDTILICCNNKEFNIFWESVPKNIENNRLDEYDKQLIKEWYEDKNI